MEVKLTPEQQELHEKHGFEYYFEPHTGQMEFSQVRTNMMKDPAYVPYCIPCPRLQRYKKTTVIGTIRCPSCGDTHTFDKEFIDRFKAKHNLS
jgi:hypothetical protein